MGGERRRVLLAAIGSCVLMAGGARAESVEVGPEDDLQGAWNSLEPGDELVMRGGTYALSGRFGVTVVGTMAAPIVIRAKAGEQPHLHRDGADQNLVDLDRAEYVTLRGLEFSGGSAGIRISAAHALTIEACEIHDTGDVALRANDSGALYDALRILRNHIHHTNGTGEGMYLGCNQDGCQLANSLIEGNHVHHTNGPTVEQGDGIEIKEGSYNNVIRDNVVHDTKYPCILTYTTVGNGAPNVIERNLLYRCGDHGIQSAADAVIRNNIILSAGSDGIAMQPHQSGMPDNLVVVHNTVIDADGAALSVRSARGRVLIANNALFTDGATALLLNGTLDQVTVTGNVGAGTVVGASSGISPSTLGEAFSAANWTGTLPNHVFPKSGGTLIGAGDPAHVAEDDFNGTARAGRADVGAYAFDERGNPGWTLAPDFKPAPSMGPAGGAGSGGRGGSAAGATGGAGRSEAGTGGRASAGRGATDAGPARDAAADVDVEAGAVDAATHTAPNDGSGCGCRAASRRAPLAPSCLGLALFALAARRIRRRAR